MRPQDSKTLIDTALKVHSQPEVALDFNIVKVDSVLRQGRKNSVIIYY